MLLFVLLVSVHLSVHVDIVFSQTKYCCTPPQWETTLYQTEGHSVNGTTSLVEFTGSMSMDGTAKLMSIMLTTTSAGHQYTVKVIDDYPNSVSYTVVDQTCKKAALGAWKPTCVPDDAQKLVSTYFGTGDNQLAVDVYQFNIDGNVMYASIASADCTPVYETTVGLTPTSGFVRVQTFANYTLGIKDRSVFDIPDICKKETILYDLPAARSGTFL